VLLPLIHFWTVAPSGLRPRYTSMPATSESGTFAFTAPRSLMTNPVKFSRFRKIACKMRGFVQLLLPAAVWPPLPSFL
jgi:hypothetical protein